MKKLRQMNITTILQLFSSLKMGLNLHSHNNNKLSFPLRSLGFQIKLQVSSLLILIHKVTLRQEKDFNRYFQEIYPHSIVKMRPPKRITKVFITAVLKVRI